MQRKHRNELLSISSQSTSKSQQNIDEFVKQKSTKYGSSDPKQKGVTNALVHFIADTMSPLSVEENPSFKNFVSLLDPKYELPSRKQLSTKHLDKVYTETEHKLKDKFSGKYLPNS